MSAAAPLRAPGLRGQAGAAGRAGRQQALEPVAVYGAPCRPPLRRRWCILVQGPTCGQEGEEEGAPCRSARSPHGDTTGAQGAQGRGNADGLRCRTAGWRLWSWSCRAQHVPTVPSRMGHGCCNAYVVLFIICKGPAVSSAAIHRAVSVCMHGEQSNIWCCNVLAELLALPAVYSMYTVEARYYVTPAAAAGRSPLSTAATHCWLLRCCPRAGRGSRCTQEPSMSPFGC